MVIYVDLIFLLNVLISFIFLIIIQLLFKDKISLIRISLASLLGGVLIIGFIFNNIIYSLFKIFGGLVLSVVAFQKNTLGKQIIKTSLFYTLNFAFVGVLEAFQIKTLVLLFFALVTILVLILIENNKKFYIFLNHTTYDVIVEFSGYCLNIKGFMDTGNFSTNDLGLPIVYISKKYYNEVLNIKEQVSIETISGSQMVDAYQPLHFYYIKDNKKIEKKVLIVFSDTDNFDCILGSMIFI